MPPGGVVRSAKRRESGESDASGMSPVRAVRATPPVLQDDLRIGAIVRACRRRAGLRQEDVARAAGASRQSVSLMERGRLPAVGVATARAIAAALGIDLTYAVRGRGASIDRLLDEDHSAYVDAVVRVLEAAGWLAVVEFSFNHYGDRGSVDVLGWRADRAALLIIEVKSELADVQALCRALDVKRRLIPRLVAHDRGWQAGVVGVAVVLPGTSTQRGAVARRSAIFDAGFPARTVEVRRWIAAPTAPMRGLWFLQIATMAGTMRKPSAGQRVRSRRDARGGPVLDVR
jgi:transcriptional regulator with XRE-family HTH domain